MLQEFGLGVIIQATDKASQVFNQVRDSFGAMQNSIAGGTQNINKDMQNMQEIMSASILGHTLANVGNQFIAKGKEMVSWVVDFAKGVIFVGDSVDKTRITLGALYKSAEAGQTKMNEITAYALKTPFEISDLTQIVTMFKAIGIETLGVGSAVTSTSGRTAELLSIMSDLASLQPQIPFSMASYAVKEYIAEGNTISMLRRMSLDVVAILGRPMAKTIEGRKQDMADLVEILGAEGLTDKLFGTWTQALSNFKDFFFNLKSKIADAGMFNSLKETLNYVGKMAQNLDPEMVTRFAKSLSDGFLFIFNPISRVVKKVAELAKQFMTFVADNPWVAKFAFGITAIAGALTMTAGAVLVFVGTMLILTAGVKAITSGFLAKQFVGLGGAIKGSLLFLGKFLLIAGLIYLAWKSNFLGIRDFANKFGEGMINVFKRVEYGIGLTGRGFSNFVKKLLASKDGFDNFAGKVLKVVAVIRGLADALVDDTLTPENYTALNELGLLPIIENALEAKKAVIDFLEGVETGFVRFDKNVIQPYIVPLIDKFKEMGTYLKDELLPLLGFTEKKDAPTKPEKPENEAFGLGVDVATIASWVGILLIISKIVKIVGGIAKVLAPLWAVLKGIAIAINLNPVVAFIVGVIMLGMIAYKQFDKFREIVDKVGLALGLVALGIFYLVGVVVTVAVGIVLAIISLAVIIAGIVQTIIDTWITAWKIIGEFVKGIKETIVLIWETFLSGDWTNFGEKLKTIWGEKWDNITELFEGWKDRFKETWNNIGTFLSGIWDGFKAPVTSFFGWVEDKFGWFLEKLGIVDTEMAKIANSKPSNGLGLGGGFSGGTSTKIPAKNASRNTYAVGSRFIPFDMEATVHRGEMIVPKSENPYANSNGKIIPIRKNVEAPVTQTYDMSVTFAEGAIVVHAKDSSPEEAERLAKLIMKRINRQNELDNIRKYKRGVS